jgi:hypothetical protein
LPAVESRVREKVLKLDQFCADIICCRVVIDNNECMIGVAA